MADTTVRDKLIVSASFREFFQVFGICFSFSIWIGFSSRVRFNYFAETGLNRVDGSTFALWLRKSACVRPSVRACVCACMRVRACVVGREGSCARTG